MHPFFHLRRKCTIQYFHEDGLRAHCYSVCQTHTVHTFQMRAEESGVVQVHTYPLYGVFGLFKLLCAKTVVYVWSKYVRSTGDKARNTSPWLWCFSWHHLKAVFVPCSRWKNQSLTATIQVRQQPKRNQDCSLQGRRCLFSCLLQKSNAEGVFAAEFYR